MIDVAHQINATRREVGARVLEAGDARVVTIIRTYEADVEDVWDACTNPERLPRWFLPVTGELRVGGKYQLHGNAGGTVERCDPPSSFFATWEFGGEVSWIDVTFTQQGEGRTEFRLEHIAHVADERWAEYGPGAVGVGWDLALTLGLAVHLENPDATMSHEEAEAWGVSHEGIEFVRKCCDLWYEAHVAAGQDPSKARAAADRTAAFYTTPPEDPNA
jgi:uncharacterized protein YndB with AHSA1/START domain